MPSWKTPTSDVVDRALRSLNRDSERQYFFARLKNPQWIRPLAERGCFQLPPAAKELPGNQVQFPFWAEGQYLKNVAGEAPEEVAQLLLRIPRTDNPRIYEDMLEIALMLRGEQSGRLKPKMLEYATMPHQFFGRRYAALLNHWVAENQTEAARELAQLLVRFGPDPRSREKQIRRKEDPQDWMSSLEPAPRIGAWEYQQLLNEGVRALAEKEPLRVALMLAEAVAELIRFRIHDDELEKREGEDLSEIWCPRLTGGNPPYERPAQTLVGVLTFACEKVYQMMPELVPQLDMALREAKWRIFEREREYLYAQHLSEQTKGWIRELVTEHEGYGRSEHHFEFQLMTRGACERFGADLLTEAERTQIFDEILAGPSKSDFKEWMGANFSEERFAARKQYFHRKQLKPFASVLFGRYAAYFESLASVETTAPISDASYSPVGEAHSGTVRYQSPRKLEELQAMTDRDLLEYINVWEDEHRDSDDWLIEITIDALAAAFQRIFVEHIVQNPERLRFWMENKNGIIRPVYVAAIVNGMQNDVKAKHLDRLSDWWEFCEWVLTHPEVGAEDRERSDKSRMSPDWRGARRAVGDFVGACLEESCGVPLSERESLARILRALCTQFDWRLDRDRPVLSGHDDPLTEAINNTRSRALEDLVDFGFWIRRQAKEAVVHEVCQVLEERFRPGAEIPLTVPERATLGCQYGRILILDWAWAAAHKLDFFPLADTRAGFAAFSSFLLFSQANKLIFEALRDHFIFAIEHWIQRTQEGRVDPEWPDVLGQHLFVYYLWGVFPLTGQKSMIERYYSETRDDHSRWAKLFEHIGFTLRNTGKGLDDSLVKRVIEFFEWRMIAGDPSELHGFSFWLAAECLDAEWRLAAYSRVLDKAYPDDVAGSIQLESLASMLGKQTAKVVECFAKLTDVMLKSGSIYLPAETAKPILKAGLENGDEKARRAAERARDNLLRAGRFDFLDLGN